MAIIGASYVTVNPSYTLPETIIQYGQVSGCFNLLAGNDPMNRLEEGDLFVYAKRVDLRTIVRADQSSVNQLPSCSVVLSQLQIPTYNVQVRAEYDHHDVAAAARWGVAAPEAHRLAMRQGIYQQMRNALLYGMNPVNNEGLLNAQQATTINLPNDSNGNDTVVTYDNGQMAIFLLTVIQQAKARCLQLGLPSRIVICGPQETLGAFEYQNIVSLTQYQRPGAGTSSTAGMVTDVVEMNGDTIEWVYDDTLKGKGAGGTDAVIISIPEVKRQNGRAGQPNTAPFNELKPGLSATVLQLIDMAAPREIPTPLAGGAIDVMSELRMTPGWPVRPEAVTIVSMQYS
jgi:hypothetical protein